MTNEAEDKEVEFSEQEFKEAKERLSKEAKELGMGDAPDTLVIDYLRFFKESKDGKQPEEDLDNIEEEMNKWRELSKEILKHFKCRECGRCCREAPVMLSVNDVEPIRSKLNMDMFEFLRRYAKKNLGNGWFYLKSPCPFLENREGGKAVCRVYESRPPVCQIFPFSSYDTKLQEIDICPLAKEISERVLEFSKSIPLHNETEEEKFVREFSQKSMDKELLSQLPDYNGNDIPTKELIITNPVMEKFLKKLNDSVSQIQFS